MFNGRKIKCYPNDVRKHVSRQLRNKDSKRSHSGDYLYRGNVYTQLEIERIERYKKEILVLDEEIFNKMFYRKIENGTEEKIGEYEFTNFKPDKNQILLKRSDQGMEIHFKDFKVISLNPKTFYTLYGIVTAKSFRTYRELKEIAANGSGQEVSDDYIRQIILRLSRDSFLGTYYGNDIYHTFRNKETYSSYQAGRWVFGLYSFMS